MYYITKLTKVASTFLIIGILGSIDRECLSWSKGITAIALTIILTALANLLISLIMEQDDPTEIEIINEPRGNRRGNWKR